MKDLTSDSDLPTYLHQISSDAAWHTYLPKNLTSYVNAPKVQKEREEEGDEFADKEKFVTSAYRKKMEEMQKLDEEEKKKEAMEQMLDVTKQKDMSGFYRHLFR